MDGVPVLLVEEDDPTHPCFRVTLEQSRRAGRARGADEPIALGDEVDAWVQDAIVGTNGNLYRTVKGRLPRYPIPRFPLEKGAGATLIDVGSNWGRWTIAAARSGYRAVGVDPSLDAALAGRRVAAQLGVDSGFVVGDARRLPFPPDAFDVAFSYSVLQHFAKPEARRSLREAARVTRRGGAVMVQMPNLFGARQLANRARQLATRDANPFRVRYWTPPELRRVFGEVVGPVRLTVDGFFSLNPRIEDLDLFPPRYQRVVRASETLRQLSQRVTPLVYVADSLYVHAVNGRL